MKICKMLPDYFYNFLGSWQTIQVMQPSILPAFIYYDTDSHFPHRHTHTQCDIALRHDNGFLSTLLERRMRLVEMDG